MFDQQRADAYAGFFERILVHTKGVWAGQPFGLQTWQRDQFVRPLFGELRDDGTRRYRRAYLEIARKNGKSAIGAGVALAVLLLDDEPGAEVYSCAASRDQARLVFRQASEFIEASPVLRKHLRVYRNVIESKKGNGFYKALSSDVKNLHGLNPHCVVFDELHTQPNRDLFDVMVTGMGARRQPLLLMLTTAGYDRTSICWEQHEHARQVAEGIVQDDALLPLIFAAESEADWTKPETWHKANPNLGVTVTEAFLKDECDRALSTPAYQNTFRRLYLNQWTQQESRWLDMGAWDACSVDEYPDLSGAECFGGLDLASQHDLASFVLVFPVNGKYYSKARFWIPEATMIEKERKDRVPYSTWARQGFVKPTPGNVIDYRTILADIGELAKEYKIVDIAFDRYGATQITNELAELGQTVVSMGQGFVSMAAPTSELSRLIATQEIQHDAHPVLRWNMDNLTIEQDAAGNMKPSKAKAREKIDGAVALIMALDRALRHKKITSIYESRDFIELEF